MRQVTSALESHSPLQHGILHVTIVTLVIMFLIMVLVFVLLVAASLRYRQGRRPGEPDQNFGNTKLELAWTALPLLLLVCLFILTVIAMRESDPPVASASGADPPPDIVAVGHQFWWEFRYPAEGFVTANEMHIPAGRRLLLRIEGFDVIHDFWVPVLGRKMDAIPGQPNEMFFEASEPGEYGGTCAEFCGAEHAWMRILVIAQAENDFQLWIRQQQSLPPAPSEPEAERGAQIFRTTSCGVCHAVNGVSSGRLGPDLTHVASRQTLAAGRLVNNPVNLEAWIADPDKYKPGSFMPNAALSEPDLSALVRYLETLR
ncbi:MAG TPA: cytochrome c oxidase subunit II [Candidatus Acidoferrum sp.]|jgi:cytochrome c oxidase subunit 2|nr:cytochrome c oxidase subunit II [Candidatus Acidoferrum sp.]